MQNIDAMSDASAYRTRGRIYVSVKQWSRPRRLEIDLHFSAVSFDEGAHTNLALAYFYLRDSLKHWNKGGAT